jgi:hypothetical protein
MDKQTSFAKQAMQWVLAVVLVFSGLLIWRFGTSPAWANCSECTNNDCCNNA